MAAEMIYRLEALFRSMLLISLRASFLVLLAYTVRRLARGLAGKYLCVIWMSVFLAFLCPVSVGIPVQLPRAAAERAEQFVEAAARMAAGDSQSEQRNSFVVNDGLAGEQSGASLSAGEPGMASAFDGLQPEESMTSAEMDSGSDSGSGDSAFEEDFSGGKIRRRLLTAAAVIWLFATAALVAWQMSRYLFMKRRLRVAVKYMDDVYVTDQIDSPILFGYIHPRIYLPPGLESGVRNCAVLHERMHLRRRDYLCKLAAFLICAAYWWNPLVWLMYRSFEADMERACDEAVLEAAGTAKRVYARALLALECRRSDTPWALGFGGSSTQIRIKNILNFQRAGAARRRISALTAVLFVIVSLLQFRFGASVGSGALTLAVCDSQEEWLLPVIEKYQEQYPGVALEVEVYSDLVPAAYRVQTPSEAGAKPDLLVSTNQGLDNPEELMRDGVFAPLDEFMASEEGWSESDYVMTVIESGRYGGAQYVMPLSYNMLFAVTSREVMEKNGVAKEGCGDILALMETLAGLYDTDYPERILADAGGLQYFPQLLEGGYGSRDAEPALERVCQAYGRLYEEELVCTGYGCGEEYYSVGRAIAAGSAYFYFPRTLEAGLQTAAGIAAADTPYILPVRNLREQTVAVTASYAGIRRDSENKQNAWNFLRLLLEEDSQYAQSEREGGCSVRIEALRASIEKFTYADSPGTYNPRRAAEGANSVRKRAETAFFRDCLEFVSQPQLCIWRDNAGMMEFHGIMEPFYDGDQTYEACISQITVS